MPPKAGLEVLPHLIIVPSLFELDLTPSVFEKLRNSPFIRTENPTMIKNKVR
jgi:hypothetical protein